MGQGDYSLTEFAHRLAQTEAKYGKEILEIIECFTNSRVDLPVKKLEELSRARMKCARHLRKMDFKKEECISLWKLCNIYSATAVDVDDAMREIRNAIRKRLKPKESSRDVSAFRRLIDEYRPSRKNDHQQEIYDKPTIPEGSQANKQERNHFHLIVFSLLQKDFRGRAIPEHPQTTANLTINDFINKCKDKQRWRELTMFGRKKEKDQQYDDYATITHNPKLSLQAEHKAKNNTLSIAVPAVDAKTVSDGAAIYVNRPQRIRSPPRPPPPSTRPPQVFEAQIPMKAAKNSLNSVHQEGMHGSEQQQNCPPIPDRPMTVLRDATKPTYINYDETYSRKITQAELETPAPRQISPGTLYKPTAPPRPSAPRTKVITVDTTEGLPNSSVLLPLEDNCAVFQLSHTTIAILPSPQLSSTKKQIEEGNKEGLENSAIERRGGVLAQRHSIKIDSNTIVDSETSRTGGTVLANVPAGEHGVVINRL